MSPLPGAAFFCHRNAHILNDECGAPEFFGNGLRLIPVDGAAGKFTANALQQTIVATQGFGVHAYVPSAISLTQSTESGTIYQPEEISSICAVATENEMATHLDGARFGNAIAALACHPGDVSWKTGIQMMSFGASKNGCLAAEALLFFDRRELCEKAERLRKRSGHLLSKMRYASAQLLAYIENGLWLDLAKNANQQAARFSQAVVQHPNASLEYPVHTNEVFVKWTAGGFKELEISGIQFLTWPGRDDLARFVFSHCTSSEETETLCARLAELGDF